MRKKEFIKLLAAQIPDLTEKQVDRLSNKILDEIIRVLRADGRAEIRGFGTFFTRRRAGRFFRSPRSGEMVEAAANRIPRFKAGRELKDLADKPAARRG